MRKLLLFTAVVFGLWGCEENIEFNNPAFQANKDGGVWKATSFQVDIDNGDLLVKGNYNGESVWLLPCNDNRGTYELGGVACNEARFVDQDGVVYSTKFDPDPSIQVYPADGEIIVESFDTVDGRQTVTGTFWFNAFTEDGLQQVNFNVGHFYRVPFTGGISTDPIVSCDQAVLAVTNALEEYNNTDPMSEAFAAACQRYETALMLQITSCGDESNVLQDIIDSLDCP